MTTKQKINVLEIVANFNERNMPNGTGVDVDFSRRGYVTVYIWDGEYIMQSLSSYNFDTTDEFVDWIKLNLK